MSELFITADPHYSHKGILRYTNRPWADVEAMNEGLIGNHNSVVSKKDTTIFIGDFAFRDHNKFLARLNGKKILIIGSHDHMSKDILRNFTAVYPTEGREEGTMMLRHNRKLYFLIHGCPRVWKRGHYGVPCIFGHSHGRLETFNLSFDGGVDTRLANYFPLHMSAIDKEVERRIAMMQEAGRIVKENGRTLYRQDDVNYFRVKAGLVPMNIHRPVEDEEDDDDEEPVDL